MNVFLKIIGVISILLLVSALICGLWLRSHPEGSDVAFHFKLSLTAALFSLTTIILFMIKK